MTDAFRTCIAHVRLSGLPAAVTVIADPARTTAPDGRMLDPVLALRGRPSRSPGGPP